MKKNHTPRTTKNKASNSTSTRKQLQSLFTYGKVVTTPKKAKEISKAAHKLIALAMTGRAWASIDISRSLHSSGLAMFLINVLVHEFVGKKGNYIRITELEIEDRSTAGQFVLVELNCAPSVFSNPIPARKKIVRRAGRRKITTWRGEGRMAADEHAIMQLDDGIRVKKHTETIDDYQEEFVVDTSTDTTTVRFFFGTNRRSSTSTKDVFYGSEPTRNRLNLGICEVSIPRKHVYGKLERPKWYTPWSSESEFNHFILLNISAKKKQDFYSLLHDWHDKVKVKSALVYVHGFRNTFKDAALRMAQITYDLGIDLTPILFSWPSKGNLLGYFADEEMASISIKHFVKLIRDIHSNTGIKHFNIIAHSMGARIVAESLQQMKETTEQICFDNILLAAPDINAELFRSQIAPRITNSPITLYAASNDIALKTSKMIHTATRIGESGDSIFLHKGIETIDSSDVDMDFLGHNYVMSKPTIIGDINKIISFNARAKDRSLKQKRKGKHVFWAFPRTS